MILVTLVVFLAAGELFDALRRVGYESATLFGIVGCTAFPLGRLLARHWPRSRS